MKTFTELIEEVIRTLEERLKFDHGFSINKEYHVQFTKNGVKRSGTVVIPSRGFPIITLKAVFNGNVTNLEHYKVIKDNMRSAGGTVTPHAIEKFEEILKQKPTEIKM